MHMYGVQLVKINGVNETKELGNQVRNIQLTWLAGTRYNREIILTGQIASASQEITKGGFNSNKGSKNWKRGLRMR